MKPSTVQRVPTDPRRVPKQRRPGGRLLALGALGLALAGAGMAAAQPAPGQAPLQKDYWSKPILYLPVQILPAAQAGVQEVQLYVKDHPTKPWTLRDRGPATTTAFPFRPAADGEYWFTVVTVDRQGKSTPPDVSRAAPVRVVVQDTQPPLIDVRADATTEEGQMIRCEARDPNLDEGKTRCEYQTADKMWRVADALPSRPGIYIIPRQAMHTGLVRVTAADRAGNQASRELNLTTPSAGPSSPVAAVPAPQGVAPENMPAPTQQASTTSLPLPPAPPAPTPQVSPATSKGEQPGTGVVQAFKMETDTGAPKYLPAVAPEPIKAGPVATPTPQDGKQTPSMPARAPQQPGAAPEQPARYLVNDTHVKLEYQIEQAGPSGVGRVEVWMTADQGQSWRKLCEDADRKSPVEIDLPGEGVFGVSLVVSNGRGFGATPPQAGDSPDWWIEVDVTRPVAEVVAVRPGSAEDAGALFITWNARDKNLSNEPIDLYYSATREGPWRPIARGLRNDGRYRWVVPQEAGPNAYVRVVVTDRAGNTCQSETPQAVALDDLSRPRARVVNVAPGVAPQGAPKSGN